MRKLLRVEKSPAGEVVAVYRYGRVINGRASWETWTTRETITNPKVFGDWVGRSNARETRNEAAL